MQTFHFLLQRSALLLTQIYYNDYWIYLHKRLVFVSSFIGLGKSPSRLFKIVYDLRLIIKTMQYLLFFQWKQRGIKGW